jgi:DNA-3-methyladenine glycosylase
MRLEREFFLQPTLEVAEKLLGKQLVYQTELGTMIGEINEVESYMGFDDEASHAARGKTPRNALMFGEGGHAYIYFIYGTYFCLNVVTEKKDFPAAILIRSVIPVKGLELMFQNNGKDHQELLLAKNDQQYTRLLINLTNGPGKLCRAFGLNKNQNGLDFVKDI